MMPQNLDIKMCLSRVGLMFKKNYSNVKAIFSETKELFLLPFIGSFTNKFIVRRMLNK